MNLIKVLKWNDYKGINTTRITPWKCKYYRKNQPFFPLRIDAPEPQMRLFPKVSITHRQKKEEPFYSIIKEK